MNNRLCDACGVCIAHLADDAQLCRECERELREWMETHSPCDAFDIDEGYCTDCGKYVGKPYTLCEPCRRRYDEPKVDPTLGDEMPIAEASNYSPEPEGTADPFVNCSVCGRTLNPIAAMLASTPPICQRCVRKAHREATK